jgi:hypothetical protein
VASRWPRTYWSTSIQAAVAAKPMPSTARRSFFFVTAKAASMVAKKAKKNFASGFSTGAPVAMGNMPT